MHYSDIHSLKELKIVHLNIISVVYMTALRTIWYLRLPISVILLPCELLYEHNQLKKEKKRKKKSKLLQSEQLKLTLICNNQLIKQLVD